MRTYVVESDISSDKRACASRIRDSVDTCADCTNKQASIGTTLFTFLTFMKNSCYHCEWETTDKRELDWVFAILTNKQKM